MNKKGLFGMVLTLVIIVFVIWIWAIILPDAVTPSIDSAITDTSGAEHAEGIEFFLRMIPWAVPVILLLGLLWVGATR